MPRHRHRIRAFSALLLPVQLAASLLTAAAHADVTIASADGRWTATIEDSGGAAGQCNGLKDHHADVAYQDVLATTKHHVRLAGAIAFNGISTARVENIFNLVSFVSNDHTYTAVLRSNQIAGVIAIVHGEMANGPSGGMRVSLEFADLDPSAVPLATINVKPFVFANMNVDGQSANNMGAWADDHYLQSANNTLTGNVRWFRGRDPAAHQSGYSPALLGALDSGVAELTNASLSGPGDLTTAMSFAAGSLSANNTYRAAYAVGGQNILINEAFGIPTANSMVGLTSDDLRWGAILWSGEGVDGFGSVGEIVNLRDFNEPEPQDSYASRSRNYLAISQSTSFLGGQVRDTFKRVSLLHSINNRDAFSAVLNSELWPGLILIMNARIVSGDHGGLIMRLQYADTLGRGLNIAPQTFVDMDCDEQTADFGGFEFDHFWQHSGSKGSQARWFRAASFAAYASDDSASLQSTLGSGIVTLNNSTLTGPANIGAAFAFHPWPLHGTDAYVTGFAVGNAGIAIPSDFVFPSVWLTCPADVAPAPGGDGFINVNDLLAVITSWGACPADCPGDIVPEFVGDGSVDVNDLIAILTNWGSCAQK